MTTPHPRFAELLAAHGAEAARWPSAERAWMQSQVRDDPAAAALLDQAGELDAALDLPEAPQPSPHLRRMVLAAVAREPRRVSLKDAIVALWRELGGLRLAGSAMAVALACGVGLAWTLEPADYSTFASADVGSDADSEDLLALAQFEDTYPELTP